MPAIINTHDTPLAQRVIDTIKTCYDPEIPVDIWELGLIYEINIDAENNGEDDSDDDYSSDSSSSFHDAMTNDIVYLRDSSSCNSPNRAIP